MVIIPFEHIPSFECISSFAYKISFTYMVPFAYASSFASYIFRTAQQIRSWAHQVAQKTETQENKSTGDGSQSRDVSYGIREALFQSYKLKDRWCQLS